MHEGSFIDAILREAADLVKAKYAQRGSLAVQSKREPNDLLTEADLSAQRLLVERIRAAYPDDAIVGEEDGMNAPPEDVERRAWVLDPIDGTQNFVRGLFPVFGVSVALAEGGRPVAGGVALPVMGDVFTAMRGEGAFRNGEPIKVSSVDRIESARIEVDFSTQPDRIESLDRLRALVIEGGQVRCHCAAVVPLVSIAAGEMDVYVHVGLSPWDFAAGQLIIEEAGGRVSRLDGRPIHLFDGRRGVLASNGHLHEQAMLHIDVPSEAPPEYTF